MDTTATLPIKRGIVRLIRSGGLFSKPSTGGIHERLAPRRIPYPFLVYSEVFARYLYDWGTGNDEGHQEIHARFDVSVFGTKVGQTYDLAQRVDQLLNGAEDTLMVNGQTVLLCRRVADMPTGPSEDDESKRILQVGFTYDIWTNMPIN